MVAKKIVLLVCAALLPALAVRAQDRDLELRDTAGRGKVGTTGMQFLKIGVGARAVGLAESFVALANDASAIYYNPAGLTTLDKKAVLLSHVEWPADINYEFGAVILPLGGRGVLGVQIGMLTTGDMKITVPYQGWTGGYFNASDWVVGVTYASRLTNRFSFGGTVKYLREYISHEGASAVALDLGTLFDIGVRGLRFGMNISNFGPDARYFREQFSLPIDFRLGVIMDLYRNGSSRLVVTMQGNHPNDNVEQLAWGMEYSLKELVALRAGYRTNLELEKLDRVDEPFEGFSFGAGAAFGLSGVHARLDYAYSDFGFLTTAQRFSLALEF
ncbi:MAG: PorV/PorQ family protein [candidate division KSB1 bacterium]|nr:PorV/PorQ family protein [candidate division KSB1 bacterium]MDZ7276548.1 PorV/PorQ family protein [candidate division KSB1 bacterium]MDZ7285033.1 PorV/PorQ family protein [candidate division KSB1 bacterium]MDZ7298065.1 PorV/PorQ family protein [candidate division KSB1 bacterium]MDZ7349302.1 PorV/PorQ family protein [candidate division KSB1 bacterium]